MNRACPGCASHEPWGLTATNEWSTAQEAAHPTPLCHALCDVFEHVAHQRQQPLGAAQPVLARAHRQPRGRLRPQVVSEYASVVSCTLPHLPSLNGKRCLTRSLPKVPAGSKLLRAENRGDKGVFCVFGVFRDFVEFVEEASRLFHPFDSLAQLPDYLTRSLFEQLVSSPTDLCKARLLKMQRWRDRAKELEPFEAKLREAMHPQVRQVLAGKRLCLLEEMAKDIQWPDTELFAEIRSGFRLVGCLKPSGVFRVGGALGALSEDELMQQSAVRKADLLSKIAQAKVDENAQQLFDVTMEEAKQKHWLEGPYTPQEVDQMFQRWLPVRRFAVVQRGKLRPIDDFKESLVNIACSTSEKIVLQALDHIIWSLTVLAHFYRDRGAVDFTLSSGERLVGHVHKEWAMVKATVPLEVATLDLKSAYKQLALHPLDYDKSVVTLKDPSSGSVTCFLMRTLPFGALASVHHFLRVSFLLHAIGCSFGVSWAAYCDDFPMVSHATVSTSTAATIKAFLKMVGFSFAPEKCTDFSQQVDVLGVTLDVSDSACGLVKIRNKQSRCEELAEALKTALEAKALVPCELPSFIGKLQYADAQIWGRVDHTSRLPVPLDASGLAALQLLHDRLVHGKPRVADRGPLWPLCCL